VLPTSAPVAPVYFGDEVPETRAARAILVVHTGVPGVPHTVTRSRAEAAELARELAARLSGGADFGALAREFSGHSSAKHGGVLGSFWPGMLRGETDEFLFAAELGRISGPIDTEIGFQVVQRIDAEAGCLQIFARGTGEESRARIAALHERLLAGEDFAELARAESDDEDSAARGGQLSIFRRGPSDAVLTAAIFDVAVGELAGPLESPLGWHLLQRVPPAEIDPALADDVVARVRAILIAVSDDFQPVDAERFAAGLCERIRDEGADMAELAREYDDSEGGSERGGDLGWILRRGSRTNPAIDRVFVRPKGAVLGPLRTTDGWLILRREQ
jgi:parvulin-like peptidyl-prolyl isomerase